MGENKTTTKIAAGDANTDESSTMNRPTPPNEPGDFLLGGKRGCDGWGIVFVGVFSFVLGASQIVPPPFQRVGRTEGTIVKEGRAKDEEQNPVFIYEVNGQPYSSREHLFTSQRKPGEKVPVVYQADNPAVACIDTFNDRWSGPVLFIAMGVVVAALGLVWQCRPARSEKRVISDDELQRIRAAIAGGRKLEAVKLYGQCSGKSLMEAKRFVEALESELQKPGSDRLTDSAGKR